MLLFKLSQVFLASIFLLSVLSFDDSSAQTTSVSSVSFTIAPPPVAYPEMNQGERILKLGGAFMAVNTDAIDMIGYLPSLSSQRALSDVAALNFQYGLGIMTGNKYNMFLMQIPFRMNVQYQMAKADRLTFFTFGGLGSDVAFSTLKVKSPGMKITVISTPIMFPFLGGLQVNYDRWDFIISPYVTATVTAGFVYSEQIYSSTIFGVGSGSSATTKSISPFANIVFGFDALYKPWGVSLSTFIQNSKDSKMVMMTLGKVIARKMLTEPQKK